MDNLIEVVLGVRSVPNIPRPVVQLVSITMSSDQALRARTMEDKGHDVVDLEILLAPTVGVQDDAGITLLVERRLEDLSFGTLTEGEDISLIIDSVPAELVGNVYPLATFGCTHSPSIYAMNDLLKEAA
jgi:hypothetical protein